MRLGPVVGFVVFLGVVGSWVEMESDLQPSVPITTVEVSTTLEVAVPVTYEEPVEAASTTEPRRAQAIVVPRDDEPVEEIDCDYAAELCETGAYICDDLADFCDYGPDDGQDISDEFEWEE